MTSARELIGRLVGIADKMAQDRTVQISDQALRELRTQVQTARRQLSETDFVVDYEATCLIECVAELAYARTEKDARREERAIMYINTLRIFLRSDLERQ